MDTQPTPTTTEPKSTSISLTASGITLRLIAVRKASGATTFAVTTDANKRRQRGCTEQHPTMDAAIGALAILAKKAEGLGWTRNAGRVGFSAKPDAFATLPAAPKPAAKK